MGKSEQQRPDLLVGIGASAGGLSAFSELLRTLPEDTRHAFVLVQHLDPDHESLLPRLLARESVLPVKAAESGAALEPGVVYVNSPGQILTVDEGRLVARAGERRETRTAIDQLFLSLAAGRVRCAGVLLSGAGHDGTAGLRELRAAGALTIVEDPAGAEQTGMPQSAIDQGAVDLVLPVSEMSGALDRFVEQTARGGEVSEAPSVSAEQLAEIARHLREATLLDLHEYKKPTVLRRIGRRMALTGKKTPADYLAHLVDTPEELRALAGDLLIRVTEFFRDPEVFDALKVDVIEPLVRSAPSGHTLRAWCAGCATGEEAYSLAMLFLEAIEASDKALHLQLFATDIDESGLSVAREGIYPPIIEEQVSVGRLARFFEPLGGRGYRVLPRLRDCASFAVHDVTKDPPFSRMDLVSCRNLLIYLRPRSQSRVLGALHFALLPGGHLLLGSSESVGEMQRHLEVLSKSHRIYTRSGTAKQPSLPAARPPWRPDLGVTRRAPALEGLSPERSEEAVVKDAVLAARVPPTVVFSSHGQVLFTHGDLEPYLHFPDGQPRLEIGRVVRPDLVTRVRAVVHQARREKKVLTAALGGEEATAQITATPADTVEEGAVIVSFEALAAPPAARPEPGSADVPSYELLIEQLEHELQATRDDLRSTVEELETANEELRTSNEEAMSMNEELQSANEELEASTEELRSLNEELSTVNAELRSKVREVELGRNDLENFFESTQIATIFLDDGLTLQRYTPEAERLLRLKAADVGRDLEDLPSAALLEGVVDEARDVLAGVMPGRRDLRTEAGQWISRSVLPYRAPGRLIEGVVVTLVDVTELKETSRRLEIGERQQAVVAQLGLAALDEPDLDRFLDRVVREVQRALQVDLCKVLELQPGEEVLFLRAGAGWPEEMIREGVISAGLESHVGYTLHAQDTVVFEDLRTEQRFSGTRALSEQGVVSGMSCVIRGDGPPYGVLAAHHRERRTFSEVDARFVQAVAVLIGAAVSRHQGRLRLSLESAVARKLAVAERKEEGTDGVLGALCDHLGPGAAELWELDQAEAGRLVRTGFAVSHEAFSREEVERLLAKERFSPGEGLVGQVAQSSAAGWITSFADDVRFVRLEEAVRLGLVTAVGFPITRAGRTVGVMTMVSTRRLIGDASLLNALETLGREVGDLVARTEAQAGLEEARLQAERSRAWFQRLAEATPEVVWVHDLDAQTRIYDNGGIRQLLGYSSQELAALGPAAIDLVHPEDRADIEAFRNEYADGIPPEVRSVTYRVRHRDGRYRWQNMVCLAFTFDEETQRVRQILVVIRDVSELKEAELELRAANTRKDEFLAMLGHELRNPLAAVRSATELIALAKEGDPVLTQTTEVLQRQTRHMANLLDGLLDVSRIARGKIRLELAEVDLAEVALSVVNDNRAQIDQVGVALTYLEPEQPAWVRGDRVRLTQIVDNLLSNAIKFTPPDGRIEVRLRTEADRVRLTVTDDGTGIPPELLPHVFEPFRQAGQALDRSKGGLGLGLALVKGLVELQGGAVFVTSEGAGHGACFEVTLPRVEAPEPVSGPGGERGEATRRVLLVEDNVDAAGVLGKLLRAVGHELEVVGTGEEALRALEAFGPDVVICDLGLPGGLTGFDVAKAVRADERFGGLLLVALSGYGRAEDKARARDAGFDEHLTKPVDLATLQRVLGQKPQRA